MNTYLVDPEGHLYEADSRDVIALCGWTNEGIGPDTVITITDQQVGWPILDLCTECREEAEAGTIEYTVRLAAEVLDLDAATGGEDNTHDSPVI